jgi:hypothetical protein
MVKAMAPIQTGVALPGGMAMGVYVVQTMMMLDPRKGALNVDIQNMFNNLCRIAMLEDVVDSEELVGVDFTHMLPYLDMAYGEESSLWFKKTRCV